MTTLNTLNEILLIVQKMYSLIIRPRPPRLLYLLAGTSENILGKKLCLSDKLIVMCSYSS